MSPSVIDQAIGILIAQAHVDESEAFELLRLRSQNGNQKLRDIAAAWSSRPLVAIADVTAAVGVLHVDLHARRVAYDTPVNQIRL